MKLSQLLKLLNALADTHPEDHEVQIEIHELRSSEIVIREYPLTRFSVTADGLVLGD